MVYGALRAGLTEIHLTANKCFSHYINGINNQEIYIFMCVRDIT